MPQCFAVDEFHRQVQSTSGHRPMTANLNYIGGANRFKRCDLLPELTFEPHLAHQLTPKHLNSTVFPCQQISASQHRSKTAARQYSLDLETPVKTVSNQSVAFRNERSQPPFSKIGKSFPLTRPPSLVARGLKAPDRYADTCKAQQHWPS